MDTAGMVEQGRALKAELPENVIIKIPCTPEGLAATKILTEDGIKTNVTLIFSASQALMAAKAGATYVSLSSVESMTRAMTGWSSSLKS